MFLEKNKKYLDKSYINIVYIFIHEYFSVKVAFVIILKFVIRTQT